MKILRFIQLLWLCFLVFVIVLLATGCAATPPPSGICLGSELECRLAKLERQVRESEDLAIMCRRNADWAICK